ncbi:MAG: 2-oxo acid dehydrogenase subunit E2 [Bdellovibrionales bacterium]|nr:2-oxo acid dehydrogenase subunit E2 [Bdellovibrionales bacterium]
MDEHIDIIVPIDQEGSESVIAGWLIQPGDFIAQHEPLVEISTDKAVVEVPAPASGVLLSIEKKENDPVTPGMVLGKLKPSDKAQDTATTTQSAPTSHISESMAYLQQYSGLRVSPAVKRLAAKRKVDLSKITGTGHAGRITKKDLETFLGTASGIPTTPLRVPQFDTSDIPSRKVPHDHMRRRIADRMAYSVQIAPHVTSLFQCDMSAVIEHRKANKESFSKQGAHLTFTAYFVEASTHALQKVPEVNSRFHENELEIFTDYNIGVGTALGERGLVVPVIQKAQTKSLLDIATELTTLTEKARNGAIEAADMARGTFTISNHGVSGSLLASPIIINQPQSAILGIGKLEKRPVVSDNDEILVKPMIYVTLTIDHRALDAHQTNTFLQAFVEYLEGYKE